MFTVHDIMEEYKRLDAQTGNNIATTIPVKISGRCVNRRGAWHKMGRLLCDYRL